MTEPAFSPRTCVCRPPVDKKELLEVAGSEFLFLEESDGLGIPPYWTYRPKHPLNLSSGQVEYRHGLHDHGIR